MCLPALLYPIAGFPYCLAPACGHTLTPHYLVPCVVYCYLVPTPLLCILPKLLVPDDDDAVAPLPCYGLVCLLRQLVVTAQRATAYGYTVYDAVHAPTVLLILRSHHLPPPSPATPTLPYGHWILLTCIHTILPDLHLQHNDPAATHTGGHHHLPA